MNNLLINKLTPNIGAELKGIDLSKTLNNSSIDSIYRSLIDNKVIFFCNQVISSKSQIDFAKNFGEIESPHPVYPHVENYKEIVLLENNKNNPPDTDIWIQMLHSKKILLLHLFYIVK